jgi:hypothetical protein
MSTTLAQGLTPAQSHAMNMPTENKMAEPKNCKKGGKLSKDVLYMCAMNAFKTNTACKTLYERLKGNGKSGKLALIAVCNKLLKQVLAVVKNNTLYQPDYSSAKTLNN